jgi:hypothetical protein
MRPNFFIVGAPKCGTTALSEYLGAHRDVFMSTPKEPHYFALDFPRYRNPDNWSDYLRLFLAADETCKVAGEASVYYLYSQVAVQKIVEAFPEAKFIVMLRDPVELAYSMHAQALYNRDENIESFERAWRMCEERRSGRRVPKHCRDSKVLQYDSIALLGEQLRRLLATARAGHVRWWTLDELKIDARKVYRDVLQFLDVPDDGREDFDVVNARKAVRSQSISQLVWKTPRFAVAAAMALKRVLGIRRWGVLEGLRRWNTVQPEPRDISAAFEAELRDYFSSDVKLLQDLTSLDLSGWLRKHA